MPMFDQNNAAPNQEPAKDVTLDELVGEGKKYATVEELVKGYSHSQAHITKLETENGDLRVKTEASKSIEQVLEELRNPQSNGDSNNNAQEQDPAPASNEQPNVSDEVAKQLAALQQKQTSQSNIDKVSQTLQSKFGSKAKEVFDAKAAELGVDLEALAAQSPALVLQSFGVSDVAPSASAVSPTGDVRSNATHDGVTAEEGTKTHLQQLRKAGKLTRSQYYEACNAAISRDAAKFNS